MSSFVDKATSKISKLSPEQISRILQSQKKDLEVRNNVLNSITNGLFLLNDEGTVVYHNKYATLFLPLKGNTDDFTGKKFSDVVSDEEIAQFVKECLKTRKNEAEHMYSFNSSLFGEMDLRMLCTVTSDGFLFSIHDYTFINRVKEKFRKNESLAAMTTMAAQVAHEIKNPLASMSIYVQLLERKLETNGSISEKDAKKALNVLSEEIERLNQIAVDFLFAVKPLKVNLEISDLNKIVRKTAELIQPELTSNKTQLKVFPATTLPKIKIDKGLVEQSLLNLVRNAMQAIEKDGLISIKTYLDGNCVKLEVSDNGCGMTDEQMSKIFEPYYTTKPSGTGLGLTTIFKIMKELGGEILVSSKENVGSVFTLSFPVPESERFKLEN